MRPRLFAAHHLVDVFSGVIFNRSVTILEFHGYKQFYPMDAYGSQGL